VERIFVRLQDWPAVSGAKALGGNRPAVAFARGSIARSIVTERKQLGLTQEALAKRAGIRQETLSRLESGKHSPTIRTVQKIERALQRAAAKRFRK